MFLSFRAKLLLAMMLVVAGVTGATLFVTQQRVQETYQKLFEEQFQTLIGYYSVKQQLRLSKFEGPCTKAAASVILFALLENVVIETNQTARQQEIVKLYKGTMDELELALKENRQNDNEPSSPAFARLRSRPRNRQGLSSTPLASMYLRILDGEGRLLVPGETVPGSFPTGARRRLDPQLASVGKIVPQLKTQQVGYLATEADNARSRLEEVILTPIIDAATGETAGALALGIPLDLGEEALNEMSEIKSGVWMDGQIYSKTIPEPMLDSFARRVADKIKETSVQRDRFIVPLNDVPHRVFYKSVIEPGSPFPAAYQVGLYSLGKALEEQLELRWRILGFSGVAMLGALAISLLLSHGLAVPIRELVAGTAEIRQGNYAIKVPVRSRDEIGHLAGSFNEMAEGLAQREKYRSILNMVADKDVAEQLMKGDVALGGETREVSILFCDIRGFTSLTQNMPPAEVVQMLNEHMTALTGVVYRHKAVVDKFVGDLIMAIFGAPKSYEHDTYNAVRCAWEMIQDRRKLNEISRYKIEVGIGIATGRVLAGCMGSTDRMNYTVLGERVNLASRLCSQAGRMEIMIDPTTKERLGDAIRVEPMPPVKLKGFSEPVQVYKLVEVHSLQTTT